MQLLWADRPDILSTRMMYIGLGDGSHSWCSVCTLGHEGSKVFVAGSTPTRILARYSECFCCSHLRVQVCRSSAFGMASKQLLTLLSSCSAWLSSTWQGRTTFWRQGCGTRDELVGASPEMSRSVETLIESV